MKVTFITPHVGRKSADKYVRTWQMEPLTIATLAGLTPDHVEVAYYDERMETIDFDDATNLVAITVETYTAKRAYEIAAEYHRRGVKCVLGGYHVTLIPEEAEQFADSIVVGYAETLWPIVLRDAERGQLQRRYVQDKSQPYSYATPRRDIFGDKKYFKLSCVETGRGCPLRCNFCSIAAATESTYNARPIDDVVQEVAGLANKNAFFVEDNFVGNIKHAVDLCNAIAPLKIRWVGQGTLNMARNDRLLEAMARSGCYGVLIGFESLSHDTLRLMDKKINVVMGEYKELIDRLHSYGIALYGTFIFGYDGESADEVMRTAEAAIDFGLFMAAFNHLVPFPGTPLYSSFEEAGKLTYDKWWLSPQFRFNDVAFNPTDVTAAELRDTCLKARQRFYSFPAIARRAGNRRGNLDSLKKAAGFASINTLLRKEIKEKDGLPLGNEPFAPRPIYPTAARIPVSSADGGS